MSDDQEAGNSFSRGTTASERYLVHLATQSFLSIWSYANLYTNEGQRNSKGDGKELCDLVVIFGNNILLFSDKHCAFPMNKDIELAWSRWYRRAVEKSVRQLIGAEKWIRQYPHRIFLEKECTRRFPIRLPCLSEAKFFRIAVARGSYSKCREVFGAQCIGSFIIDTAILGPEHLKHPFRIGEVAPQHGYVHVLDEHTLDVLLQEFDTISDFVNYLEMKEQFLLQSGCPIQATGEEQLVAFYITNVNEKREHAFPEIPPGTPGVLFEEGDWEATVRHPQYLAKKEADRISYVWDNLIEHFIANGRDDDGKSLSASLGTMAELEPALRAMASEPRFYRRQLAAQLLDAMEKPLKPSERLIRLGAVGDSPETVYVFLIAVQPPFISSYGEYLEFRRNFLMICCKSAIVDMPDAKLIVGIATEPNGSNPHSETFVFFAAAEGGWTQEERAEAISLKQDFGILKEPTTSRRLITETEYPDISEISGG